MLFRSPVTWFLFDLKSGFCNYYASAEVLLLRSVGIPARMVVGFAQGKSVESGLYAVRGRDAHAWPEVYFQGIGWVQFEPTVNQAVLIRPSGDTSSTSLNGNSASNFAEGSGNNSRFDQEKDFLDTGNSQALETVLGLRRDQWLWVIIPSVFLLAILFVGWKTRYRDFFGLTWFSQKMPRVIKAVFIYFNLKSPSWLDRWLRWSAASRVERAYHAVNQSLMWLDKPQPDHVTPAERAVLLKKLIPEASEYIDILNLALEKSLFTPYFVDETGVDRASWMLRFFIFRKIIRRWLFGE